MEGRGEKLGNNLVVLDDYLKRMNPKIPLLVDDLGKLATVSDTYAEVAPELAKLLRNSVTTGNTFVEKEAKVQALFQDVASFSSTSKDFLEQNGDEHHPVEQAGPGPAAAVREVRPGVPLPGQGHRRRRSRCQAEAFRGYTLHINLETLPRQPRGYTAGDQPVYAERGENAVPLGQCQAAINGKLQPAQPSPELPRAQRQGRRELPPRQARAPRPAST